MKRFDIEHLLNITGKVRIPDSPVEIQEAEHYTNITFTTPMNLYEAQVKDGVDKAWTCDITVLEGLNKGVRYNVDFTTMYLFLDYVLENEEVWGAESVIVLALEKVSKEQLVMVLKFYQYVPMWMSDYARIAQEMLLRGVDIDDIVDRIVYGINSIGEGGM